MRYYLAPLEGITGYIYRRALHKYYPDGIDKYFAPFIMPYEKHILTKKELNQLMPEHNEGIHLIPQIMTSDAKEVIRLEGALRELGYDEYNLNLGCPSGTVVSKGRGAGFLSNVDGVDEYLDYILSNTRCKVSVKTRMGMHDTDEFYEILDVYNKYSLEELIIHPRVRDEGYKGTVHRDMYEYAVCHSTNPLVYNGDITTVGDCTELVEHLEDYTESTSRADTVAVMIGRGVIANPALIRDIYIGKSESDLYSCEAMATLRDFLGEIEQDYLSEFSGETPVLHKLKEIWSYLGIWYKELDPKAYKNLMKAKRISEYHIAMKGILAK